MRFEDSPMYQTAEKLIREVDGLMPRARRYSPNAADHLERASESVLFNLAEGLGSYQPKVKITAYNIVRKEANEVRAILSRLCIKGVFNTDETAPAQALAGAVVGMVTNAIKSTEKRVRKD